MAKKRRGNASWLLTVGESLRCYVRLEKVTMAGLIRTKMELCHEGRLRFYNRGHGAAAVFGLRCWCSRCNCWNLLLEDLRCCWWLKAALLVEMERWKLMVLVEEESLEQSGCWIWRGRAAVIQLQEGLDRRWEVGSCGWLFYSGLFGFWGCSGVYGGCTVGALIWLKTKLSFQVKWSLSWLEGFGLLSGLWWFEGYFWVCFVLTVLGSWQCSSPSPASWGQGFWTILL